MEKPLKEKPPHAEKQMKAIGKGKPRAVVVVVPLYKPEPDAWERQALAHNLSVVEGYTVVFLHPEGMDVTAYRSLAPGVFFQAVSRKWLGTERGIAGYNDMMLSQSFYEMFSAWEYVLVCHSDAWLFGAREGQPDLEDWCAKGYDVVAAPWVSKPLGRLPGLKEGLELWRLIFKSKGKRRPELHGKVGNGGLSLRKVSSFIRACAENREEVEKFKGDPCEAHNEDIFWATVPSGFRYPGAREAAAFAMDCKPELCWRMNGRRLPFGCHGYHLANRWPFWKRFLPSP